MRGWFRDAINADAIAEFLPVAVMQREGRSLTSVKHRLLRFRGPDPAAEPMRSRVVESVTRTSNLPAFRRIDLQAEVVRPRPAAAYSDAEYSDHFRRFFQRLRCILQTSPAARSASASDAWISRTTHSRGSIDAAIFNAAIACDHSAFCIRRSPSSYDADFTN